MVVMRSITINSCYRPYGGLSIVSGTSHWHAVPHLMMALHSSVLLYYMKTRDKR